MANLRIIRIVNENKELLNGEFFDTFPYASTIDHAAQAEAITADDRTYLLLAYKDNTLAGYTLGYRFPALFDKGNMAYLYDIEVLPQFQQKGIATALINRLITTLKSDGCVEVWLGTDIANEPAKALYIKTGAVRSDDTFYDFTYDLKQ